MAAGHVSENWVFKRLLHEERDGNAYLELVKVTSISRQSLAIINEVVLGISLCHPTVYKLFILCLNPVNSKRITKARGSNICFLRWSNTEHGNFNEKHVYSFCDISDRICQELRDH